jgi:hypothetical protein
MNTMPRTLLLVLLASTSIIVRSQTLDISNAPLIGDQWTYANCGVVTLAGTGTDQTWDASGVTVIGSAQGVECVSPQNTTAGETFPDADVALASGGTTSYMRIDQDGITVIGAYVSSLGITSIYTDPVRQMVFPAELNDSWSDDYVGSYTYNGQVVQQSGEVSCTVSGIGDLALPWGTVENVLRLDMTDVYTEAGLGNTFEMVRTLSEFYRPGLRTYVARLYTITTTMNGAPGNTSQGFLHIDADDFTGMADGVRGTIGMEVFPNPTSGQATVILAANGVTSLDLHDATGKLVLRQRPTTSSGLIKATLDLEGLPPGVYSLRVQSRDGDTGSTRLVVTR